MTKVLIVDDNPQRYKVLVERLSALGVSRADIKFSTSSNDALEEIQSIQYDLLVLDILLPLWSEETPNQQNSVDLLFSIKNDADAFKPHWIIGISSDLSAASDVLPEFEANTWTIVNYSASSEDWIEKILNCFIYLRGKSENLEPVKFNYDLVVVCALSAPELEEVIQLPWGWSSAKPLDDITFFREGQIQVGGKNYKVAAVSQSRMGMVSSAIVTAKAIQFFRPRVVAMTGICAGHPGKTKLGDVLVADPAWDFQSGKVFNVDNNVRMEFSPHQIPISDVVRARCEQMAVDRQLVSEILTEFGSDGPSGFKIRVGPVASGGAVLADGKIIESVRELQNRDLLGIEMEIYGVYASAQQASSPQPKFVAIKGVCDYADREKHDGSQRFAAFASARVLQKLIERYALDIF